NSGAKSNALVIGVSCRPMLSANCCKIPGRCGPYSERATTRACPEGEISMKAAVLGENGVEVRDLPKPEPKPNEVVIRVRASSLNRADLSVAMGHQHGRVGGVGARIGLECAGDVEAVGSEVADFKPGDR